MRTFCSAALFPASADLRSRSGRFATISDEVLQRILFHLYDNTLARPFDAHYCTVATPCAVARETVLHFKDLERVSKRWEKMVARVLKLPSSLAFRPLDGPVELCHLIKRNATLCRRYRPYQLVEKDSHGQKPSSVHTSQFD